ncbi:MAG: protoporphyrinogen oxidase HemJ [Rhodovarius sp.]|nr:protoporphyrinogen oxidase HemJ [Rhodovarius sp.]MDW8314414.1 protoporphyrinogen oxidase HemJ [Rhodovarius sp.]
MHIEALAPIYPWVKAFHTMAVIAWMAGLFYLPRLFIYHLQVPPGGSEHARFVVMERRLLRAIMNPAMIAAWILGLMLVLTPGVVSWSAGWWHSKLLAVVLMSVFHMALARARRGFEAGARPGGSLYWRVMNEVPTLLMIIIVIMVIVKPF